MATGSGIPPNGGRSRRAGNLRKRTVDEFDNFQMTQDDVADKVTWETHSFDFVPKPTSSISSSSLIHDSESGFGWKGLREKRRKENKSDDLTVSSQFRIAEIDSYALPVAKSLLTTYSDEDSNPCKENQDNLPGEAPMIAVDNAPPTLPLSQVTIIHNKPRSQSYSMQIIPSANLAPIDNPNDSYDSRYHSSVSKVLSSSQDFTYPPAAVAIDKTNLGVNFSASKDLNSSTDQNHLSVPAIFSSTSTLSFQSENNMRVLAAPSIVNPSNFDSRMPLLPSNPLPSPVPSAVSSVITAPIHSHLVNTHNMNSYVTDTIASIEPKKSQIDISCDVWDFSEEDFAKLDAQIAATQAAMGMEADQDNTESMTGLPQITKSTAIDIGDIEISEADLAMLDAIEQQVLSTQQSFLPPPPASATAALSLYGGQQTTIQSTSSSAVSSSCYNAWKADELPSYLRLKISALEKFDAQRCTRIVAVVCDESQSKVTTSSDSHDGTNVTRISVPNSDVVLIDLVEDWYYFSQTDADMLNIGDVIHVVLIDGLALQSTQSPQFPGDCAGIANTMVTNLQPLTLRISNETGLLIVAPDTYVSPTKVADSCQCARRGVMVDRFRSFGLPSVAATMGKVRHYFIEQLSEKVLQILQEITSSSNGTAVKVDEKMVFSRFPPKYLQHLVLLSITENVEELYAVQKKDDDVKKDLFGLVAQVVKTMVLVFREGVSEMANRLNHSSNNKAGAPPIPRFKAATPNVAEADYQLQSIQGIEESIQSPILGIKGQVDLIAGSRLMSVQTTLSQYGFANSLSRQTHTSSAKPNLASYSHVQYMLPLEVKTGRWKQSTIVSHRAQVILYLLLMALRRQSMYRDSSNSINSAAAVAEYTQDIARQGLLLYISKDEVKVDVILPSWMEMRALMIARNKLACQIQQAVAQIEDFSFPAGGDTAAVTLSTSGNLCGQRLPPLKRAQYDCTNCYSAAECMLSHAALEQGSAETSGVVSLYQHVLRGICAHHLQYWLHWDRLLDLEAFPQYGQTLKRTHLKDNRNNTELKRKASIFTLSAADRQGQGETCCGGLRIVGCSSASTSSNPSATGDAFKVEEMDINDDEVEDADGHHQHLDTQEPMDVSFALIQQGTASTSVILSAWFVVGDRLLVSLEQARPVMKSRRIPPEINANVCSGHVVKLSPQSLTLRITQGRRYLLQLLQVAEASMRGNNVITKPLMKIMNNLEVAGWSFRLDKDESNVNIATMRANLTDLFVEPYLPSLYFQSQRKQLQSVASEKLSDPSSASGPGVSVEEDTDQQFLAHQVYQNQLIRQQLRAFIVDFQAPEFHEPPKKDKQFMLFCPPAMSPAIFVQAMSTIRKHKLMFQQYDLRGTNAGNKSSPAPAQPLQQATAQPVHAHRGPYGEFIVQPGPLIIYPGCHPFELHQEYMSMNADQQQAVQRILLARDYALLRGLPGTGKTNTLALVIRMMIARQETVLLTSYTHNAVDHLLQKLIAKGMLPAHVLRLGAVTSVASECLPYSLQNSLHAPSQGAATHYGVADLSNRLQSIRLFAGTVFTASRHMLLRTLREKCDWCVLDEAGQITQPAAVGALLKARKFVLVGDEKQLPPLVISTEAQKRGMDQSLLQRLLEKHPTAAVTLTFQYRMHRDIMSLCNRLVYGNIMHCGNEQVAEARVSWSPQVFSNLRQQLSSLSVYGSDLESTEWLFQVIAPERAVVWVNTDGLNDNSNDNVELIVPTTKPAATGGFHSGRNEQEAKLIQLILHAVYICQHQHQLQDQEQESAGSSDCKVYEIAVITPFRAQVHHLQSLLQQDPHLASLLSTAASSIVGTKPIRLHLEVSTVDKFQGKDKDIVIFSTVKKKRSSSVEQNPELSVDEIGNLLRDWRRINVAITRAKMKLIVLASSSLVQQALLENNSVPEEERMLSRLWEICVSEGWTIDLPGNGTVRYQGLRELLPTLLSPVTEIDLIKPENESSIASRGDVLQAQSVAQQKGSGPGLGDSVLQSHLPAAAVHPVMSNGSAPIAVVSVSAGMHPPRGPLVGTDSNAFVPAPVATSSISSYQQHTAHHYQQQQQQQQRYPQQNHQHQQYQQYQQRHVANQYPTPTAASTTISYGQLPPRGSSFHSPAAFSQHQHLHQGVIPLPTQQPLSMPFRATAAYQNQHNASSLPHSVSARTTSASLRHPSLSSYSALPGPVPTSQYPSAPKAPSTTGAVVLGAPRPSLSYGNSSTYRN